MFASCKWIVLAATLSSFTLTNDVETDWTDFAPPGGWEFNVDPNCIDYFNFGNPRGKLSFTNGDKKVVYYAYEMDVLEKIKHGAYAAFFDDKNCEQYGDWKVGSFPNFRFNKLFYCIDLCNTSGFFNVDGNTAEYMELSNSIYVYITQE